MPPTGRLFSLPEVGWLTELSEIERIAKLEEAVKNLTGWQATQNGSLQRIDSKVDGIYKIMIGTAGTAALSFLGTIITLLAVVSKGGR